MTGPATPAEIARRAIEAFRSAGAVEVAPDVLLPAETLLDLYGEDIRARAYLSHDPLRGEVVLRPDFTVPVVQMHMAGGADPARYCYLGKVFRKQDHGDTRPEHPRENEYLQAGFELFSRHPAADAEVFALFHRFLAPFDLRVEMGDMQLLLDSVAGLPLSDDRRATLAHHIWRPGRFDRLLDGFSRPEPARAFAINGAPWTGMRTEAEMEARIARLADGAGRSVLAPVWRERLHRLFSVAGPAPAALDELRVLAEHMPSIAGAVERLAERLDGIAARGIDVGAVRFDASHGRRTMEYYDGMTFSFGATQRPEWPAVARGGRYDALTAVLGQGRAIPAVGGIVRPDLLAGLAP